MDNNNENVDFKINMTSEEPVVEKVAAEDDTFKVQIKPEEKVDVEETKEVEAEKQEAVEESTKQASDETTKSVVEEKEQVAPKSREELFNELLVDKYKINESELQNVLSNKEKAQELPEEVFKYLEYKKETNRGLEDYVRLNEDLSNIDNTTLLKQYYQETKPGLDESDINSLLDIKYGYEEGADESVIKTKTLEMKEEVFKAKQHFESQKKKYRAPLESSDSSSFEEQKKAVEFYNLYKEEQTAKTKQTDAVRKVFQEKTSNYFNNDFKGFEFNVGEENLVFKPKNIDEMKKSQSDLNNFINRHTDESGALVDAKKYHTALSMAMNPEAYAKFFYEQGRASAINKVVKDGKNINMDVRTNVETSQPGPRFKVLDSPFMEGLKIKKRR